MSDFDTAAASLSELFYSRLISSHDDILRDAPWISSLPTKLTLLCIGFGRPDSRHSFTQEASFETTLLPLLRSGFLNITSTISLLDSHPLILHLATSYVSLHQYDFRWLWSYNSDWASQTTIPPHKQYAMLACLFDYDLDTSLLMQYLGNKYTGAYWEVQTVVATLRNYKINHDLIEKYVQAMLTGCPNHFVAETTWANALLHWRLQEPSHD
jgi:hypothetical protein